jgi:hypothetical protein
VTVAVYPHAAAIIEALTDAEFRVGDHAAPKSTDGRIVAPCAVVYMTPGPIVGHDLTYRDLDALIRFRVVTVAITPAEAAAYQDRVAAALTGLSLIVGDRATYRIHLDTTGGVERDDDLQPPLFYCSTGYRLLSISNPEES